MIKIGYLVAAVALVASACSSDSSDESATPNEPSTTTEAPTTSTAATTSSPPTTPTTTEAVTTTSSAPTTTEAPGPLDLEITSPLYEEGDAVPVVITCEGDDISPQLDIAGLPAATVSMVVIMEDPDAPVGVWDHWVSFDVEPTDSIPENAADLGTLGANSWGDSAYGGPCPPPESGPHRYISTVYALDANLDLDEGTPKSTVLEALDGRVLAQGSLMGTFER